MSRPNLRTVCGLAAALLCAPAARAITSEELFSEPWRWATFTTEHGLPSNELLDLVESPKGTTWVSTRAGIAWFDGYQWKKVGELEGLPSGSANSIAPFGHDQLLVVLRGQLYVGGVSGFAHVELSRNGNPLLVDIAVAMESSRVLVQARALNDVSWALYAWEGGKVSLLDTPTRISAMPRTRLRWTRDGSVWMTTDAGLMRWSGNGWEVKQPAVAEWYRISDLATNVQGEGVLQTIFPRVVAGLWTWSADGRLQKEEAVGRDLIGTADIAPNGDILALCHSGCVKIRKGGQWISVKPVPPRMEVVSFVRFGSNGDLWVGAPDGLHLYRSLANRWEFWQDADSSRRIVNALLAARDGTVWVGTAQGLLHYKSDGAQIEALGGLPGGISFSPITGLAEDADGGIWASSGRAFDGAVRWDGKTWKHFGKPEGLDAPFVHRICKDRSGHLWFMGLGPADVQSRTEGPGAFRLVDGRFEQWGTDRGLLSGRTYAMAEGPDGTFWFGTFAGVSRFREGRWTHWTADNGLKHPRVYAVAVTPDNRLWFGQQGEGLGYIDEEDRVRYVDDPAPLVNKYVLDLQVDDHGRMWVGSSAGLFSLFNNTWSEFSRRCGLVRDFIWPVVPLDDRVLVGTDGSGTGILHINAPDRVPPRVVINDLATEGSSLWITWSAFACQAVIPPTSIETRYRLDEQPWSPWSMVRDVTLRSLPPGRHRIQVQAKGLFGDFDPAGIQREFDIAAPAYRRPKIMIPVALLAFTAVGLGLILVTRQRRYAAVLLASRQQLQSILDNTPAVIYMKDPAGKYISINQQYEALFHISRKAVVGKSDYDIFPRENADAFRANDLRVLRDRQPILIEETAPHDDGPHNYISAKFPLYHADGTPYAVCGISTDISERIATSRHLAERAQHAALIGKVGIAFTRGGPLGEILQQCSEAVLAHLDAALARIWTFDEQEAVLRLQSSAGLYTHVDGRHSRIRLGEFKIGRIAQSRRVHLTNSVQGDEQVHDQEWARREGLVAFAGHPLLVQGRLVGVIGIFSRHPLTETTARTLETLADEIALGIDHKRAEEALQREQVFLKALLASVSEGIVACDADGNLTLFNDALQRLHNISTGDASVQGFVEKQLFELDGKTPIIKEAIPLYRALAGEEVRDRELLVRPENAQEHIIAASGRPITAPGGRRLGAVVAIRDITERKRAEESLRDSEERFRATLGQAAVGISETDPSGRYLLVNQRFCDIVGFTEQELLERRFHDITHPDDLIIDLDRFQQLAAGALDRYAIEKRYRHKSGSWVWVDLTVSAVRLPSGEPRYFIAVIEDITQRRQAEEALRRQALVFDNIHDGVILTDVNGRITDWNPGAERMFGYGRAEMLGKSPQALNRPEEAVSVNESIRDGIRRFDRWEGEISFVRKDGTEGIAEVIVVPFHNESRRRIGAVSVNRDITARKFAEAEKANLEAQLRQSQKMEAVGTLASGVAHDFNNLLQAIFGYAERAKATLSPVHPAVVSMEMVEQAAQQARGVINSLLTFCRKGVVEKAPVNLSEVVHDTVRLLLRRWFSAAIEIVESVDPDIWVFADSAQMGQVLMNLALNARDAMPAGGRLRITLTQQGAAPGDDGDQARLIVEDTGKGMSEEVLARIYEPFFTTKPRGQGTGLGLSMILGIVNDHKGRIEIVSEPGRGTTATVGIPCCPKPERAAATHAPTARKGKGERILVVEDHEHVRSIITSALRANGYEVLGAGDAGEAVERMEERPDAARLIVLDLDLPRAERLAELRERHVLERGTPVILMTGAPELDERWAELANGNLLRKPFPMHELVEMVGHCLTGSAAVTEKTL
jgi:PAS domain S-box-containing protein